MHSQQFRFRLVSFLTMIVFACAGNAQDVDQVYMPNIRTPQLFVTGNQLGYPILRLNSNDQLELHFDDLDGDVKNYYYGIQLCNADWTPALVSEFDYLRGFSQVRISNYQYSSVALTRYTHYQAVFPDANCTPVKSGNYLLKVFLDGDTSKLAFTRRLLVVDPRITVKYQYLQPVDFNIAYTHQRIQFKVNTSAVNPMNPLEQIKVVVLQNFRWDNCIRDLRPTFVVNNSLEYTNDNDCIFPGGSEWRWVDLQSFRFQSDRIRNAIYGKTSTEIFLKPDYDRSRQPYLSYSDYDGFYFIQTTESINPLWQTDYATVHFSFVPSGNIPYPDKDLYLLGALTGGALNDSSRMIFNAEKGVYERTLLLKQGYYSYSYVTADRNDPARRGSFDITEGNHLETENNYMILVYYRAPAARADELLGIVQFNTSTGRK